MKHQIILNFHKKQVKYVGITNIFKSKPDVACLGLNEWAVQNWLCYEFQMRFKRHRRIGTRKFIELNFKRIRIKA